MFRNICLTLTAFFIGFISFSQVRKDDPVKKVADTLIVADTLVKQDSINMPFMAEFIWGKQLMERPDTLIPGVPDYESKKIVWVETRSSGYTTSNGGGVGGATNHMGHVWYNWRYQNSSELMKLKELKVPMSEYPVTKELWDQILHRRSNARKFGGLAIGGIVISAVSGGLLIKDYQNSKAMGGEGKVDPTYLAPLIVGGVIVLGGLTGMTILNHSYLKNVKSAINVYNSCVGGSYQSSIDFKLQIGFSNLRTPSVGLSLTF